jgi:hypothetical protein
VDGVDGETALGEEIHSELNATQRESDGIGICKFSIFVFAFSIAIFLLFPPLRASAGWVSRPRRGLGLGLELFGHGVPLESLRLLFKGSIYP